MKNSNFFSPFKGKNVLITGGESGVGKLMGKIVLQRRANFIIWDIHEENLNKTLAEYSGLDNVTGYVVDIMNLQPIKETASLVRKNHEKIDVLINNAGIIVGKYFHEDTTGDISRTMDINATAPMYITLEFLPGMMGTKFSSYLQYCVFSGSDFTSQNGSLCCKQVVL
jgi:short-subunit dehydrogenase involved in D-alanine esterification of teichoic acids